MSLGFKLKFPQQNPRSNPLGDDVVIDEIKRFLMMYILLFQVGGWTVKKWFYRRWDLIEVVLKKRGDWAMMLYCKKGFDVKFIMTRMSSSCLYGRHSSCGFFLLWAGSAASCSPGKEEEEEDDMVLLHYNAKQHCLPPSLTGADVSLSFCRWVI